MTRAPQREVIAVLSAVVVIAVVIAVVVAVVVSASAFSADVGVQ